MIPNGIPPILLVLALGLTLTPFLSIFSNDLKAGGYRPSMTTMVASAISPVALALCVSGQPPLTGLLLAAAGFALSLLIRNLRPGSLLVVLGTLSMGLYLQLEWLPA